LFQKNIYRYIQTPEIKNAIINLMFSISSFLLIRSFAVQIGLDGFGKYNYFATTLVALVSVLDFGVSNTIITKIFKLQNSKSAYSIAFIYSFFQLVVLIITLLVWRLFDPFIKHYILFDAIILLIVIYYNKNAWNIFVSYFIKYKGLKYLFRLAIIYCFLSLFLNIYWPVQFNPLYVLLLVLGLIYLVPVYIEGALHNFEIRQGFSLLINTIKSHKNQLIILFMATLISSFCIWFERFFLVNSFSFSMQAVFGLGIISLNILSVFLNGALRIVWSNDGKVNMLLQIGKSLKRYSIVIFLSYLLTAIISGFIILILFNVELSIPNFLFFYLILMSCPLLVLSQYHTIQLYNLNKYSSVANVVIFSSIINICFLVLYYFTSTELTVLIDFAIKGVITLVCSLTIFNLVYNQKTIFTNALILFSIFNIIFVKSLLCLFV
tara:strand:+ start:1438 stop:2745 length:1308 start_codon:yes stop_codon:yes gene_type:complete